MVKKLPSPDKKGLLPGENQSGNSTLPGAHNRKGKAKSTRADVARIKAEILSLYEQGHTQADACRLAGRGPDIWVYYCKSDPDFKEKAALITARRNGAKGDANRDISFAEFSEKYLHTRRFWHQLQWIDLIEGRDPRDLHPGQVFRKGDPDTIIINTPPGHAKSPLALDTEVQTPLGFTTIGALREGDSVFGPDGKPAKVLAKSPVFEGRRCFRVTMNCGESFTADAEHLWTVRGPRGRGGYSYSELTTLDMFETGGRFVLPAQEALHLEGADLLIDPYLLGCWLGDGHTASGRFTTKDPEIVEAFAAGGFDPHQYSTLSYDTHGFYRQLAELGLIGHKDIPEGYLLGDYDQRLALLQGLMDTDGTISGDGQASFTSTNRHLSRGVLYLASSLGLRPTMKESRATLNGKDCGPKWTVWYAPQGLPIFRLPRKLQRVRPVDGHSTAGFRSIVSIEEIESVPTQCIFVDNDSHLFLLGRSLVPTHNTTITMDYVTYKIVTNPEFRVVIISKTETMAKKFLAGVKRRLTGRAFSQLQIDFAPPDGFEQSAEVWSAKMIYFGHSDSDQKDPNIEVLGIGQQIYGARADLIILDDVEDLANAHQYATHLDYIMQDVMTRDAPLLVVGTRVAPVDLYTELMNPEHYDGEESDWTYLSQPAVLQYAEDPKDWVTLWPYTDRPHAIHPGVQNEEGLWPKWDGPRLSRLRKKLKPKTWALVYMQETVSDDSTFTIEAINGVQTNRMRGVIPPHIQNLHMVAGLDPATNAGFTACIVFAVDRVTGKRYLVDVFNQQVRSAGLRQLIEDFTEKYNINEWRIEKNAFQAFLTQDREINQFLAARGVRLKEHSTGLNKRDADWGVSSLESLFRGWQDGQALLDLPGMTQNEAYRSLKEQLCSWFPEAPKTQKIDLVMALWFAELAARDATKHLNAREQGFLDNGFLSQNDRANRVVIDIDQWLAEERRAM